jgi:hypothetical protein
MKKCSCRDYVPIIQCPREMGSECLVEDPSGEFLARGSMPLLCFVGKNFIIRFMGYHRVLVRDANQRSPMEKY